MINVNQITSQLARMPDQALQQYAQMHKNDPYTVTLALAESNRRKEMRTGAQGQQGMAPQPKVVDQDIAGMAQPQGQAQAMPEDVGIGALPAPNMQGMAEGGIVAFAGGGAAYETPYDRMNRENRESEDVERATRLANLEQSGMSTMPYGEQMRNVGDALLSAPVTAFKTLVSAPGYGFNKNSAAPSSGTPSSNSDRGNYSGQGATGLNIPYAPADAGRSGTTADAGGPRPAPADAGRSGAGAGAPRAPTSSGDFLTQQQALEKRLGTAVDPLAEDRKNITAEAIRGRREGITALKADQESDMAEMRKGQEGRINKREGEIEKSKDTNTGLAFLEAGLAMMQAKGPGLAAIAQGAGIGVKQYSAGIDKIKSAQEKLDDARDRMEELRQNQASMNKREIRTEERGISDLAVQGQKDLLTGTETAIGKQAARTLAATASDVATQGRREQMASAERIAANANTRAIMSDARADTRARLSAAQTLMKESGDMLSGPTANMLSEKERATYMADYNSAKAMLQGMGGVTSATPAEQAEVAKLLGRKQ